MLEVNNSHRTTRAVVYKILPHPKGDEVILHGVDTEPKYIIRFPHGIHRELQVGDVVLATVVITKIKVWPEEEIDVGPDPTAN